MRIGPGLADDVTGGTKCTVDCPRVPLKTKVSAWVQSEVKNLIVEVDILTTGM